MPDEARLSKRPLASAYLRKVGERPRKREIGSHASLFLRRLGFIDDEVEFQGTSMTASEAAKLDPFWYLSAKFTGRDRITALGRQELARLRK